MYKPGKTKFVNTCVLITLTLFHLSSCQQVQVEFNVSEGAAPPTFVGRISVGQAPYSFISGDQQTFSFNVNNGEIRTRVQLDRETTNTYILVVSSLDSMLVEVTIRVLDVNDNAPSFALNRFTTTIYENVAVGTTILSVSAIDYDLEENGRVNYLFGTSNDPDDNFSINPQTGMIRLKKSLDYEQENTYELMVIARDNGSPSLHSTANVVIEVLDVNDNAPQFTHNMYHVEVPERSIQGSSVLKVQATDADEGINAVVKYSLYSSSAWFQIDSDTGLITTKKSNVDCEKDSYSGITITVVAADSGNPPLSSTATVSITVRVANDIQPVFYQTEYSAIASEDGTSSSCSVTTWKHMDGYGCAIARLKSPPLILTKFKNVYYHHEAATKETNFTCKASGTPRPKISWHFQRGNSQGGFHLMYSDEAMNILSVGTTVGEPGMFGTYTCVAENAHGKAFARFQVERASFEVNTESKTLYGITGAPLSIDCELSQGSCWPSCVRTWYINGSQGVQRLQEGRRIAVNNEGQLFFSYLTMDDISSRYSCMVYSPALRVSQTVREIVINHIPFPGDAQNNPLQIAYPKSNHTNSALVGESVTLECIFSGSPTVQRITWERLNPIGPGIMDSRRVKISDNGRKLTIYNVSATDAGTYSCRGISKVASLSVDQLLEVKAPRKPLVFVDGMSLSKLVVLEGSCVVLHCHARDFENDYIRPQWYRNSKPVIASDSAKFEMRNNDTDLIIQDVTTSDTATFQCIVSNNYGHIYGAGYINVFERIKISVIPGNEVMLQPGTAISLLINATSSPGVDLFYNWSFIDHKNNFHNQQYLSNSKYHKLKDINQQLDIIGTDLDKDGILNIIGSYIVAVSNQFETREREIIVSSDVTMDKKTDRVLSYKKDLVILLDASKEMRQFYMDTLKAIEKLISDGQIDAGQLRVGFVIFGFDAQVEFFLNNFTTTTGVIQAMHEQGTHIPRFMNSSSRNTAAAFKLARTKMFTEEHGGRLDAPDEALLIAAGKSNIDSDKTIDEADAIKAADTQVTAMGLGVSSKEGETEISSCASEPGKAYFGNEPKILIKTVREVVFIYRDEGPKESRNDAVLIVNTVIFAVLLICGVAAFLYFRRRYKISKMYKFKEGEIMKSWKETIEGEDLLSDTGLRFLSSKLDADWEIFATEMDFERATIDQIKNTFHGGDDKIFGFLKLWRYRKKGVTLEVKQTMIIDALEKCELNHIIKDIHNNYGDSYATDPGGLGSKANNIKGGNWSPTYTGEEQALIEMHEINNRLYNKPEKVQNPMYQKLDH